MYINMYIYICMYDMHIIYASFYQWDSDFKIRMHPVICGTEVGREQATTWETTKEYQPVLHPNDLRLCHMKQNVRSLPSHAIHGWNPDKHCGYVYIHKRNHRNITAMPSNRVYSCEKKNTWWITSFHFLLNDHGICKDEREQWELSHVTPINIEFHILVYYPLKYMEP